jgi:hypothetical protein
MNGYGRSLFFLIPVFLSHHPFHLQALLHLLIGYSRQQTFHILLFHPQYAYTPLHAACR